jgi:nitroimidazol reductase NimA-like FMN-containing flavoprotein (pyridoxamine 5'-phosphate oxidase superfamily)
VANSRAESKPASERVRLRRRRERGHHDRATIDAILDEALIAHLGFVDADAQPFVIPTLHARDGDVVYLHGSSASRALRTLRGGARVCLAVSLIDGLVLARAAMHHSANYRSAMLFGTARPIESQHEKLAALQAIVEHIVPGRWAEARPPSANELKATAVLALPIDEASAKVRSGPPLDDDDDYELDVWAGVIPLTLHAGAPQADRRLRATVALPDALAAYSRIASP